jgi:hypothetical protein
MLTGSKIDLTPDSGTVMHGRPGPEKSHRLPLRAVTKAGRTRESTASC